MPVSKGRGRSAVQPEIDPFARQYVRAKVQQLLPRARSAGMEAEDIEAELLLNLVRRRRWYDRSRGRWTTYVRLVTDHHSADLLERWSRNGKRLRATISLSTVRRGRAGNESDALPDEANDRRHSRHPRWGQNLCELTVDVRESIEQLPPEDRQVCEAILTRQSVAEAADSLGLSRSQFARRVRRIRKRLERRDLHRYL